MGAQLPVSTAAALLPPVQDQAVEMINGLQLRLRHGEMKGFAMRSEQFVSLTIAWFEDGDNAAFLRRMLMLTMIMLVAVMAVSNDCDNN